MLFRVRTPEAPSGLFGRFRKPAAPASPASVEVVLAPGEAPQEIALPDGLRSLHWAARTGRLLGLAREEGASYDDLLVADLPSGTWHRLDRVFGPPVELADGLLGVRREKTLAVLEPDGSARAEVKLGRYGTSLLCASPGGTHIAYSRRSGGDDRLCVTDLCGQATESRTSFYRCAWWDAQSLAYYKGADLKRFDMASGATSAAWGGLLTEPADPALRQVLESLPEDGYDRSVLLGELLHDAGRVLLAVRIAGVQGGRGHGRTVVVSIEAGRPVGLVGEVSDLVRVEALTVSHRAVLASVAAYEGMRVVDRYVLPVGPEPSWWGEGWRPVPETVDDRLLTFGQPTPWRSRHA